MDSICQDRTSTGFVQTTWDRTVQSSRALESSPRNHVPCHCSVKWILFGKKKNVPFKVSNLYMAVISINNSLQRVHGSCTQWIGEAAVTFCGRWRGQETKLILTLLLRSWVKEASAAHCNTMKLALVACSYKISRVWANKAPGDKRTAEFSL